MKNFKLDFIEILDRKHMKNVFGGNIFTDDGSDATCTADCGGGTFVNCPGVYCMAIDNVGCTNDEGEKRCPDLP